MQETDQSRILEELRSGSEKVLKEVYEDNRAKFLNFARRYNLSEEEHIDIYQDAYIVFYENVMNGKLEKLTSSVSTYLFSIGKHLIFDRMRKNKKSISGSFDLARVGDSDEEVNSFDVDRPELTREQKLLQEHFKGLGTKCQELLSLFYYRGYTIQEIMKAGNYNSENVVKAAKSRCMKTLKERIKGKAY
ncbi:RNA polymerase sigma factor [Pseudozobellia thermophila]|uniref:RNA polymerase sigma factor, sigma-70 family n=1 Tax=Pseudozobellia thermophila TaxID=192903 RepID=A0A1M6NHI4_9FLAO|nr:sigma-70 family RNA polymerase sigma factor [Pseudozobellia thermophila]SHJ95198.1 RNA polymerase sigma factor, sigma-70 family [Pseudozobellia thermophila]